MPRAIRVDAPGGPEVLRPCAVAVGDPGPGEARVRIAAAGVNFIDVLFRAGIFAAPRPFFPGLEAAGTLDAVGPGGGPLRAGDRVVFVGQRTPLRAGAYAEEALFPLDRLVLVPPGIDLLPACALALQGATAHYLCHDAFALQPGQRCLIQGAASGVGLLLCQLARLRGARVLGVIASPAKEALVRQAGAEEVVVRGQEDFVAAALRFSDGAGVQVVYEGIGRETLERGFDCLARRGTLVLYGEASGPAPPVAPSTLERGSFTFVRPDLFHYIADGPELAARLGELFRLLGEGRLAVRWETLRLEQAGEAHARVEGRGVSGKLLLIP